MIIQDGALPSHGLPGWQDQASAIAAIYHVFLAASGRGIPCVLSDWSPSFHDKLCRGWCGKVSDYKVLQKINQASIKLPLGCTTFTFKGKLCQVAKIDPCFLAPSDEGYRSRRPWSSSPAAWSRTLLVAHCGTGSNTAAYWCWTANPDAGDNLK